MTIKTAMTSLIESCVELLLKIDGRFEQMAQDINALNLAIVGMGSAVTDAKNNLDTFKVELAAANARLLDQIKQLKDQVAALSDFTQQVSDLNARIGVIQSVATDIGTLTDNEKTL